MKLKLNVAAITKIVAPAIIKGVHGVLLTQNAYLIAKIHVKVFMITLDMHQEQKEHALVKLMLMHETGKHAILNIAHPVQNAHDIQVVRGV